MTGGILSAILTKKQNEAQRDWSHNEAALQRNWEAEQNAKAMAYNTSEREASQAWDKEMWNLNNEYNSPSAQMQRMVSAGINPNSAAAQIAGGVASSAPTSTPASVGTPSGSVAAPPPQYNEQDAFTSLLNTTANYKAQLAQADLSKSMARKTEEETHGLLIDNSYKPFEKEANLSLLKQHVDALVKKGALDEAQANQINQMTPLLKQLNLKQQAQLLASANLLSDQRMNLSQERKLLEEQIETEKHRRKQMDAAAYEAYMAGEAHKKSIEVMGVQMSLDKAEMRLRIIDGNIRKNDNAWRNYLRNNGIDPDAHGISRLLDFGSESILGIRDAIRGAISEDDLQLHQFGWDDADVPDDLLPRLDD